MWSASSRTAISTASSFTMPCFMRSSSRPGQASATGEFVREAGHERDRERECLPGSSLAAAEDIAALKRRRERGDLNGEGVGFAELREGVHETGGDAELREANFGGCVEGDLFVHCCAFPTLCPQKRNAQQLCRSVRLGSG